MPGPSPGKLILKKSLQPPAGTIDIADAIKQRKPLRKTSSVIPLSEQAAAMGGGGGGGGGGGFQAELMAKMTGRKLSVEIGELTAIAAWQKEDCQARNINRNNCL